MQDNDLSTISMQCPLHATPLTIVASPDGNLFCCQSGCNFPVVSGIPRFVSSDCYASSFGLQWKTFRKTQLDSYTGTTISRDRLTRIVGGDLASLRGKSVLEAGCGAGRFTEILLSAGANVFAVDLSSAVEANYENCRSFIDGANYFVCQADIRSLPLAPGQFDVVLCVGVIQHTPNPEETIAALCSHLKPGGMLAIDHYTHGYGITPSRQLLRNQLRQMPADFALSFCSMVTDLLWPVHELLWKSQNSSAGVAARQEFLEHSPLVDYHDAYPQLSADILRSWALLDTHDTVTDLYKHLRSAEEIAACLAASGMQQIDAVYAGNGVEARAVKAGDSRVVEMNAHQGQDSCHVQNVHTAQPTKVMFLAWGDSIHARRRIGVFIDDPDFDVAVVSTYDYHFENAKNYLLDGRSQDSIDIQPNCPELHFALELRKRLAVLNNPDLDNDILPAIHDFRILKRAFDEFSPDVIFLQTLLYPCHLAYFLPHSVPFIVTFWNGDVTWWAEWDGFDRELKKQVVTYGALNASAVTVNSEIARDACLEYGVLPERIHLIRYPGADVERFKPRNKAAAKQQIGFNSRFMVFCPRGLGGYLNSEFIIEAAAIVCKKLPDVGFVFASAVGFELWNDHLTTARMHGIEQNLHHAGQIKWDLMPHFHNAADVMISISSKDSLPNCMLEAMASGTPVVMGDIPPIRDWITDAENGFLVPIGDTLALADRIMAVLEGTVPQLDRIVDNALCKIIHEANGPLNCKKVKDLVKGVAITCKR